MLKQQGKDIVTSTVHKYAKRLGYGRTSSEARRNWDEGSLDYKTSYLTKEIIEAIDGFMLGDGGIDIGKSSEKVGRLCCGVEHQEFCKFMMNFFKTYNANVSRGKADSMKNGIMYSGRTRVHPDLYEQYKRWYINVKGKNIKNAPKDVRITPVSVMLWYLGDGSVVVNKQSNTIILRLSTDGFPIDNVEMLQPS